MFQPDERDHEYVERERRIYEKQMKEIDNAPRHDKNESQGEFLDNCKNKPEIVAERIHWLLLGSYDYYANYLAWLAVKNNKPGSVGRRATLFHLIAAVEWRCPRSYAQKTWRALTDTEKATLDRLIDAEIDYMINDYGKTSDEEEQDEQYTD